MRTQRFSADAFTYGHTIARLERYNPRAICRLMPLDRESFLGPLSMLQSVRHHQLYAKGAVMSRMFRLTGCLAIAAGALVAALRAEDPAWIARSNVGMVASDSPEASQIGAAVLKAGGNAFDAAVATSFALAVARPESTGLGGGGFMVAYVARDKRFVALDFRETAPAGATPERYAKLFAEQGNGPSPTIYGGNASTNASAPAR